MAISIPQELLPADGRFGCGPSKVSSEALAALAAVGSDYMGTSHRQPAVRNMVGRLRTGLAELFSLPDDWEIVLGNGGTTLLWDALTFGVIDKRSEHLVFGEFSGKFATAARLAPHLGEPVITAADPGAHPNSAATDVDLYALTHNETSTGVAMAPIRPSHAPAEALIAVDATSAAGGLTWDPAEVDIYYFAPQKCLASDGGLWIAACSPAALERIERIGASRWVPAGLDMRIAVENSVKNQTYNTPALATIFLTVFQVDRLNSGGGLSEVSARLDRRATDVYQWADNHPLFSPFVAIASERSSVVATIDVADSVNADDICAALRDNGIVDTEAYRKLGRNQMRIAMFPSIDDGDLELLTRCIDHIVAALAT